MPDEQPKEAPKPVAKKKASKKVAKKRASKDPAARDAKHKAAQKDADKRLKEVASRTPVYAKQLGEFMILDKLVTIKDRSGQAKNVSEREEMGLEAFHAAYEPLAGTPNYYTPKGS